MTKQPKVYLTPNATSYPGSAAKERDTLPVTFVKTFIQCGPHGRVYSSIVYTALESDAVTVTVTFTVTISEPPWSTGAHSCMEKETENEVFVDAEEEVTPRRSGRKRRSTAGSSSTIKKLKAGSMPTQRSPKRGPNMEAPAAQMAGVNPAAQPDAGQQSGNLVEQMQAMMGTMLGGMEGRLNKASTEIRTSVDQALTSISDLNARVSANENKMSEVMGEMESLIDKKIEEGLRHRAIPDSFPSLTRDGAPALSEQSGSLTSMSYATALSSVPGRRVDPTERRETEYWACRKALRIRPVVSGNLGPKETALEYMERHLKLDSSFLAMTRDGMRAEFVPFGPKSKYKNELLLRFESVEARDVVRSSATNLAGKGQEFGVRLEVPNHLKAAMRALQTVSFEIKQRNQEARRNILYDDESCDLVLDFQLKAGSPWKRLTSDQARAKKKMIQQTSNQKMAVGDDELDDILGGGEGEGRGSSG